MPHLRTLVERYKDDPFVMIGIDFNDQKAASRQGIKDFEITWPVIFDGQNALQKMFKVSGAPTYFIIDGEGKIRFMNHFLDEKLIDKLIAKAKKAEEKKKDADKDENQG